MQFGESEIREFQALCKRELGVELSAQEAASELRALVTLVRLLLGLDAA
jgi:hypothetical protein